MCSYIYWAPSLDSSSTVTNTNIYDFVGGIETGLSQTTLVVAQLRCKRVALIKVLDHGI